MVYSPQDRNSKTDLARDLYPETKPISLKPSRVTLAGDIRTHYARFPVAEEALTSRFPTWI